VKRLFPSPEKHTTLYAQDISTATAFETSCVYGVV